MSKPAENMASHQTGTSLWLGALLVLYAGARVLQVFPGRVPMLAVIALHVLPPAVFAMIHGTLLYRPRGILTFAATCLVIGNIFENVGVRTGFPLGVTTSRI